MQIKYENIFVVVLILIGVFVLVRMYEAIVNSLRMAFVSGPVISPENRFAGVLAIAIICFTIAAIVRLVVAERN